MSEESGHTNDATDNKAALAQKSEKTQERVATIQPRGELSAAALGRMLGLATEGDIRLMEGKIDLLSSKVNQLIAKMERVLNFTTQAPTGADLERIDVQIGSLKSAMFDFVSKHTQAQAGPAQVEQRARTEEEISAAQHSDNGVKNDERSAEPSRKKVTLSSLNT